MNLTKPSITRIARIAGVKSLSEDTFELVRELATNKLEELIRIALIVNTEHNTKTLMSEDIYEAISYDGINLAQSNELGEKTCSK